MTEVKDMSEKELKEEWLAIESHIRNFAYGRFELNYREELLKEINKRELIL